MKKWFIWMGGIVVGAGILIYIILQFAQPQMMKAFREVSFPAPSTVIPPLHTNTCGIDLKTFKGQVTLVSFFATWCGPCHVNHDMLKKLVKDHNVNIVGINLRDTPMATQLWLMENGNPFRCIGSDPKGHAAAQWEVRGIPQMFIVDKRAQVRLVHTGPLTQKRIDDVILPLLAKLKSE